MKKIFSNRGFSLAEILLTITIIGVLASMTIPEMILNAQTQEYKSAWKKEFTMTSQAIMNYKENNEGYIIRTRLLSNTDLITSELKTVLSAVKTCKYQAGCWHPNNTWYDFSGNPMNQTMTTGLILADGALMTFGINSSQCSDTSYGTPGGSGICAMSWIDTNGFKKPNTIGKDIFGMWIQKDAVRPMGTQGDLYSSATNCQKPNNGRGCGARYLLNY